MNRAKKKVFVGLSGGVDSAVSAAILKDAGYDVTGVFIKVWSPDFLPCTWRDERRDAMRIAAKLDIPFLFFDFEDEYKKGVADYMIEEYKLGRTPNPDVLCNREIKFGAFWKKAKEMGADLIATGHYAQVHETGEGKYELKEGKDPEKDQSYFLWTLTQEDLSHTLFPVGNMEKKEVRKLADKYKLSVANKKDSQGICFLGDVNLEDFLSHFVTTSYGDVLNTNGEVIGRHKGAIYYTLGERHGFKVTKKTPEDKAFYVVSKDMKENTIVVSNNPSEILSYSSSEVKLGSVNWISELDGDQLWGRIRYRHKKIRLKLDGDKIIFEEPQTVASGQSVVFYSGVLEGVCLGGGVVM